MNKMLRLLPAFLIAATVSAETGVTGDDVILIPEGKWRQVFPDVDGAILFNVSSTDAGDAGFSRTSAIGPDTQEKLPAYVRRVDDISPDRFDEGHLEGSTGYAGPYPEIDGIVEGERVRSGLAGMVRLLEAEEEVPEWEALFRIEIGRSSVPSTWTLGILTTNPEHARDLQVAIAADGQELSLAESLSSAGFPALHVFTLEDLRPGQEIIIKARPRWVEARGQAVAYIAGILFGAR